MPRSPLIMAWEKSWHTPSRRCITCDTGVEIVVTPERKRKSCVEALVQVQQRLQHRASLGEGLADIVLRVRVNRRHRGAELELNRLPARRACGLLDHVFPVRRVLRTGGGGQLTSTTDSEVTSKSACGRSMNSQVTWLPK